MMKDFRHRIDNLGCLKNLQCNDHNHEPRNTVELQLKLAHILENVDVKQ